MSSEWLTTDRPDVVACMGSVPACAAWGCQARRLAARLQALAGYVQHKPDCDTYRCAWCGHPSWMHDLTEDLDEETCAQRGGKWTSGMQCNCGLAACLTPASAEEPEK